FDRFVEDGRRFVERIAAFAGRPVPSDVLDALPYGHRENIRTTSTLTLSLVRRLNQLAPPTDVNPAPLLESPSVARLADRLRPRGSPLKKRCGGRARAPR